MGLMGFKRTFSWNGNTSQSCRCTTLVWYVENLLSVYIKTSVYKKVDDIIQSLLRLNRYFVTETSCGTRPTSERDERARGRARRVIPQHLFSSKQTLRTYHSGESSSFVVDPNVHGGCVGSVVTAFDHPWSTSPIPLGSASAKKAAWKSQLDELVGSRGGEGKCRWFVGRP